MRDIKGFEGLYAVTSCGRVWSYRRNKFLKPVPNSKGYLFVDLYVDGKHNLRMVHRLVAEAYIPNHNNYETVDHIDNNKLNNCLNNLQWMSRIDNNSKECPEQAPIRIRCVETGEEFESLSDCTRKMGIHNSNLSKHLRGLRGCANGLHFERID